ncbi:MAG: 16S rRNA (uracil(1498)-N(3))-methyltransferase, partial [Kiritimatiellae bacterium]|nr:16S rRNA (uracil(1498)-N(3))-methyltransferase [Kiritimatiellia bacterium]
MSYTPKLRAYAPPSRWAGEEVFLDEGESKHLCGVMRAGPGTPAEVLDGAGRVGRAVVAGADRKRAVLRLEETRVAERPRPRRTLVQALVREQQMDWLIQKATELGVAEIVPVQTAQCVVRIGAADAERKARRWREIALAACKQSGNPWVPEIAPARGFREVLDGRAGGGNNAAFGALREGARGYAEWLGG